MDKRIVVPAIHDWHLEKVLNDLGLLGQVQRGLVTCNGCGDIVTMDNLSALKLGPNQTILLVCNRNDCLAGAWAKK